MMIADAPCMGNLCPANQLRERMPFCRNTGPEHQKQKRQRDGQSPRMSGQHQQADDCADPGSVAAGTQRNRRLHSRIAMPDRR